MGRQTYSLDATASLSRHNSEQDDMDNAAWNAFVSGVRELANQLETERLPIYVYGEDDLPINQWSNND